MRSVSHNQAQARQWYFRGLGVVYLIAFLSLWSQVHGLIGERGVLPTGTYFHSAYASYGASAYRLLPSLCWLASGDLMLHLLCVAGTLISVILLVGVAPRPALCLLWIIYLSLSVAGQEFLGFQWDSLLLEMAFCSLIYAPRGWRPDWTASPGLMACVPLWGLAFKLMFLSGVTKLLSGDTTWRDGTALEFHCFTQPIPNWPAWFMYQMPAAVHRVALVVMYVIEVLCPFLVFAGHRGRALFGAASIGLMIAIEVTGNFGFFNLQSIVLCLPLLNDNWFQRFRIASLPAADSLPPSNRTPGRWRTITAAITVGSMMLVSLLTIAAEMSSTAHKGKVPGPIMTAIKVSDTLLLSWGRPWVLKPIGPLRTINGYGLFRVMTIERHEIVMEISDDGTDWTACEFLYKPGRVDRAPPLVAPHMPRLDWQMWFAALNLQRNQHWLGSLINSVLDGNPTVLRLLGRPELIAHPPKYVRRTRYDYKFTNANERRATGVWWNRSFEGNLTGPIEKGQR